LNKQAALLVTSGGRVGLAKNEFVFQKFRFETVYLAQARAESFRTSAFKGFW